MNKAHVSFILDKSGSMESVQEATISGFNEYIQSLKSDKETSYTFDLTFFDTTVRKEYTNSPLELVNRLHGDNYRPNGGTALYDAVCETLLSRKAETGGKWIVVVMTDGEENSSKTYDEKKMADMVKLLTNTGNVTFVFLGANQDAWANASKWNFSKNNVAYYNATEKGTGQAFTVMASSTRGWAGSSATTTSDFFSSKDQDDLKNTK